MIVLQQLKLSIEESHNANDGNAKGCGEKHFVEHLFLLVYGIGLGQTRMICWYCLQASKGLKTGHLSHHTQLPPMHLVPEAASEVSIHLAVNLRLDQY